MSPQVHLFSLLSRNVCQGPVVILLGPVVFSTRIGCTINASLGFLWGVHNIVEDKAGASMQGGQ